MSAWIIKCGLTVVLVGMMSFGALGISGLIETSGARAETSHAPLVRVAPDYPEEALALGLEGRVRLRFMIGLDGSVEEIGVVEASDTVFVAPAIKALSQWQYRPVLKEGEPQRVPWWTVVSFLLEPPLDHPFPQTTDGFDDPDPIPVSRTQPVYPRSAAGDLQDGFAVVAFTIATDGAVKDLRLERLSDRIFRSPAMDAVKTWRFAPQTRAGVVTARPNVWIMIEFRSQP